VDLEKGSKPIGLGHSVVIHECHDVCPSFPDTCIPCVGVALPTFQNIVKMKTGISLVFPDNPGCAIP
jgi:hypothetical protein